MKLAALLTSTSMWPNRSTAAWTAAAASSRLLTSSFTTNRSSASPTAVRTASVLRPVATTAFPAARAALAKSTPIPRPAPVTIQTFLSVSGIDILLYGWVLHARQYHRRYSPECVEGVFSEVGLPLYGVLRCSPCSTERPESACLVINGSFE